MFEQLNKFYVKFKLTVNDSCEIWILHSLNSWYHHLGAVEFSLQTLEKINYPLHFEMSMIILARLKSPFGRPKEPNQKKTTFAQLKCFNFPLQRTCENWNLVAVFFLATSHMNWHHSNIRTETTLSDAFGIHVFSLLRLLNVNYKFWLPIYYHNTKYFIKINFNIQISRLDWFTLIDSCDISTGVIRLSADKRCKRSRACCSTAITNASWTALPSSPAAKEIERKNIGKKNGEKQNN